MSRNSATYYLTNICKGDIMFWSLCSQTVSVGKIKLIDDDNTYFDVNKKDPANSLQILADSSAIYNGGANLRIQVDLNGDCNIKEIINSYNMTDSSSRILGCGYSYCLEDYIDNDFNDYYINVVAWKNKG